MEVVLNKFEGIQEECPFCKSILKLKYDDYLYYRTSDGQLREKHYTCPCCRKVVVIKNNNTSFDSSYDPHFVVFISLLLFFAIVIFIVCII